uniref:Spire-type actin nucleation factor 2 n=1 Tax=Amphiprion percula TaxID=161767 RepID=A0A3P8SB48_AMPPE
MEEMNISEEEESPDNGELRRTESSPTPLKRDRSFSEHDLAMLRGEMLPSLSESTQLGGTVRLRGERPRSRTLTGAGPLPHYRASFPVHGWVPPSPARLSLSSVDETSEGPEATAGSRTGDEHQWMEEFSHPVESLALTVDEVINVRRVLVKAEMEKFLQSKELYNNLKKGKVPGEPEKKLRRTSGEPEKKLRAGSVSVLSNFESVSCRFAAAVESSFLCSRGRPPAYCAKDQFVDPAVQSSGCWMFGSMKIPSKKMAHIPVYTVGFHSTPKSHGHKSQVYKSLRSLSRRSVEEEFPHLYAHGCTLRDVCAECTKFVADVISSSRRSLDILNNTPKREARPAAAATGSAGSAGSTGSTGPGSAAPQRPQLQRQANLEAFPPPHHAETISDQ